jgi:hypothetical protein
VSDAGAGAHDKPSNVHEAEAYARASVNFMTKQDQQKGFESAEW